MPISAKIRRTIPWILLILALSPSVRAHFQMMIPQAAIVPHGGDKSVAFDLLFAHPFDGEVLDMTTPIRLGVLARGQRQDLLKDIRPKSIGGHRAFELTYRFKRPGDHVFFMESAPYLDEGERLFHVFYAKTVVNAFEMEGGWDAEVGFPAEIVPTVRPYGLWTGNLFQGIVKKDGKPAAFAEVEIEYHNQGKKVTEPLAPFSVQVVKTDAAGRFSYAMPRAGWWGFVARFDEKRTLEHDGKQLPVRTGAVMWVHAKDMK